MRSKEEAHDYRYFPDPDLLPLELDEAFLAECRETLPELPDAKRKRYEGLGITAYNASVLTAEVETARWFDALLETGAEPKQASNWVVAELFGALNRRNETLASTGISPEEAAELLKLVADGTISGTIAKQVFEIMLETGEAPSKIVEERGLKQTSDTGAIDAAVDDVLAANADKVAEYKSGKVQLFGFFVGQVMKAMQGKANPGMVNERLRSKLD
jgi:aspartyl-tRNA(Asn)/glutamyl-tRNA(Gln) amidotransferase subunit B